METIGARSYAEPSELRLQINSSVYGWTLTACAGGWMLGDLQLQLHASRRTLDRYGLQDTVTKPSGAYSSAN